MLLKVRSIDLSLEEKFFLDFSPEILINRTNNVHLPQWRTFTAFALFLWLEIFRNISKSFFSVPHLHVVFSHATTFAFVIVKSEKNYIIIVLNTVIPHSVPSPGVSIDVQNIFNSSRNSNSNGYSGLFFGLLFQNEGQSNFHSFKWSNF